MNIRIESSAPTTLPVDLLVIPISTGDALKGMGRAIDKVLGERLSDLLSEERFSGKEGESLVLRTEGRIPAGKVAVLGIGGGQLDAHAARRVAARATKLARRERAKSVALLLDVASGAVGRCARTATEGALLGDYHFLKYRDKALAEHTERNIASFALVVRNDRSGTNAAKKGLERGELEARGTMFARGLVNEPASEMTPTKLMEIAVAIANGRKDRLSIKVVDEKGLKAMKAGGILAVAKGSDEPPYLLHLTYKPKKKAKKKVVLVGKGITFDSGGLSLKPAKSMEDMKIDMAGAAAVLGVFSVIADLAPNAEVHGITAVCENMPSGKATRPGDIVRTMNGTTIEILNTDAEGRVTLADTLHYGTLLKPNAMIDMATLTGACMVALGQEVAGLMSNDDRLAKRVLDAAGAAGELMWQLPLPNEYADLMKGSVSDLKNVSSTSYGGAITAGIFLKEFVGDTPWCHLDIAGPAWAERDTVPYQPRGATGFGVRAMLHFLETL
jgi:leucyl aminopeptidase